MEINIKYFDNNIEKIKKMDKGDWIDLRCVGAKLITVSNKIIETNDKSDDGCFKLERKSYSVELPLEYGYLEDNGIKQRVEFFRYSKGDFLMLDLGIAMQLPEGYEANVVPRSSTFKNFTILQTNSFGVIDESYRGDKDRWFMPVLAMQDGFIIHNERICQFRVNKKMESVQFNELEKFDAENRGGHGSSGTK